MCIGIPKKVISVKKGAVIVLPFNSQKIEEVQSIIKTKKGDWVITQNKIIIDKISNRQAKEIIKLL